MTSPARIRFVSTYRGITHYMVMTGPMQGRRIEVRHQGAEFYQGEAGGEPGLAGMVHSYGEPVTQDVLDAVGT